MGIRVNPDEWGAVFAVPSSVADEHLRRASGQQLKVLLLILRHSGESLSRQAIADGTGLSPEDAADALCYWTDTGFLLRDGTAAPQPVATAKTTESPKSKPQEADAPKRTLQVLPDITPTYDQVNARVLESPELQGLFTEAQASLGRTLGYDAQAKLLMMVDSYGLPPEVILTIIGYAASRGKTSMAYITSVGKNWAEEGIDDLEKAEDKLRQMDERESLWGEFVSQFPASERPRRTGDRFHYLVKWRTENGQSLELIRYAYERTIENINKANFKYMDTMLSDWHRKNLKTPTEVLQAKDSPSPTGGNAERGQGEAAPSYDSGLFRKKATGPIAYRKRSETDGE